MFGGHPMDVGVAVVDAQSRHCPAGWICYKEVSSCFLVCCGGFDYGQVDCKRRFIFKDE